VRVALISDLHANELALDAVLADAQRRGYDRLICLGDVATLGPRPRAVLARLAALGCDCVLGNHDEYLVEPELIHGYTEAEVIVGSVAHTRDGLDERERAQLAGFVRGLAVDLGRGRVLRAFHGSPRSHSEDLLATTPAAALDDALEGHLADVMVGGHTHLQMMRNHRGRWLVNPGSVGLPFEAYASGGPPRILAHAEYALVTSAPGGVDVTLCRVELDRAALRSAARGWDDPLAGMLAAQYS
jgi:predicted phosphodiesterase